MRGVCAPSHRRVDPLSFASAALAQGVGEDPDVSITRRVENAILAVPALRVMDIRVGTRERKVWLTGFVRSIADIHEADTVTREVNGVDAVYNHLRIADRRFHT